MLLSKFSALQLQDLAISPEIRDPRLNTAECVIEGHEPDMEATGRSYYIMAIILCTLLFAFYFGSFLGHGFNYCELNAQWSEDHKTRSRNLDTGSQEGNRIRRKNTARALCYLGYLLTIVCSPFYIANFFLLYQHYFGEISFAMIAAWLSFVWFTKVVIFCCPPGCKRMLHFMPPESRRGVSSTTDATRGRLVDAGLFFRELVKKHFMFNEHLCKKDFPFIIRAVLGLSPPGMLTCCFCSCWMLIGIMLNPTWGLTLTMLIGFSLAAFTYEVYQYYSISNDLKLRTTSSSNLNMPKALLFKAQIVIYCFFGLLVVICLDIVIVLAGQSYNGRETADETLKTALLSALGAFVSWVSWKTGPLTVSQGSEERQTQSPPSGTSANEDHTPRHPPPAGDSLTVNGQTFEKFSLFPATFLISNTGNIQRNATLGRESLSDIATAADAHQPPSSDTSTNTQDLRREALRRGDSSSVTVDVHQHPSDTAANTGQTPRNHQPPLETYVDSSTEDSQTIEHVQLIPVYESTV